MNLPHDFNGWPEIACKGTFSHVTFASFENEEYAIKFISTKEASDDYIDDYVRVILQEIFFAKIASALGIGPSFHPLFGYDCVIFEDGVEFFMEKCLNDPSIKQIRS